MEFANATITGAGRKDSEKRVGIRAGNETLTGSAARDPAAAGEAEGDGGRRHAVGLCPSPRLWHGLWGNAGGKEAERQVADDGLCYCMCLCSCPIPFVCVFSESFIIFGLFYCADWG
jgi:hypothetical protein